MKHYKAALMVPHFITLKALQMHYRADRSLTGMAAVPLSRDSVASTGSRGEPFWLTISQAQSAIQVSEPFRRSLPFVKLRLLEQDSK